MSDSSSQYPSYSLTPKESTSLNNEEENDNKIVIEEAYKIEIDNFNNVFDKSCTNSISSTSEDCFPNYDIIIKHPSGNLFKPTYKTKNNEKNIKKRNII